MNPLRPAFKTSCRFMPKPSATTEHCRSMRATPRLSPMYGCLKLRPKRIPTVSAIGGENNPVNESASITTKIIFAKVGIDWEKGIRPGAGWASKNRNLFRLNVPALLAVCVGAGLQPGILFLCEVGFCESLLEFHRALFFLFFDRRSSQRGLRRDGL